MASPLLAVTLVAAALAPASAAGKASRRSGGSGELDARTRNVTTSLLTEFAALRDDVGKAWQDFEEVSATVGPQVKRLSLKADHLREVIKDARKLRVPSIAKVCEELGACGKCAASPVCGWCTASMKCIPGSRDGPADEAEPCPAAQYSYEMCAGMSCKAYASCDLCTRDAMCGWCSSSSTCIDGTEWGPSRAALALPFLAARQPCDFLTSGSTPAQDKQCMAGGTIGWVHRNSRTAQTCSLTAPAT